MDVTRQIQAAVAWADIIACCVARYWIYAAVGIAAGVIVGRWVFKCLGE